METFLLIRYGGIGNALVSVPAVRALRAARPGAFIVMVVDPTGLEALSGCPYVDRFILYDKAGRHRGLVPFLRLVRILRSLRPTATIHFKRFRRSEFLGWVSGASTRVGFSTPGRPPRMLTVAIPYTEGKNIIDVTADLVRALGIPVSSLSLEIWPGPADMAAVNAFLQDHGLAAGGFLTMHPGGATLRDALWSADHFAAVGRDLAARMGGRVVLVGGPQEHALLEDVSRRMSGAAVTARGLGIRAVAELIKRSRLFIGMDSGPSHLADAVGTPGIILFRESPSMDAQVAKWKPLGPRYTALSTAAPPDAVLAAAGQYLG